MTSKYSIEVRKITIQNFRRCINRTYLNILNPNEHTLLYNFDYEYKENESDGPKIKDIKDFLFEEFLLKLKRKNTCKCIFSFWGKRKENPNQLILLNYNDGTYLKDTEFKESHEIQIFMSYNEVCTCRMFSLYIDLLNQKLKEKENTKLIEGLKQKIEEQNKEKEKQIEKDKNIEEENKKLLLKIKELEEKIFSKTTNVDEKAEKKEKKKKKIKKATDEFLRDLPNIVKLFYTTNLKTLIAEFVQTISTYFESNITFEEINKELIENLAEKEQFALNIKNILENKINSIEQTEISNAIKHFNVLLIGRSGAGKSTLLNKVLQENLAETKNHDNCTKNFECYESKKVDGLRLWDSRGSEEEYNINKVFEDVKKLIQRLINEKNPDKYIHSIWYCIKGLKGERFNKEIQEIIKNCYEIYSIQNLPVIIVFSYSIKPNDSQEFIKYVKENIQNYNDLNKENIIKCVSVLAEPEEIITSKGKDIIPSYGIYKLMTKTFKLVKKGMISSFTESLTQEGKNFLREEFEKTIDNIKNKLYKENLDEAPTIFNDNNESNQNNNFNNDSTNTIKKSQSNSSQNMKEEKNISDTPDNIDDTPTPNKVFDIKNIKLDTVKYNSMNFIINMKNICEEVVIKLLHKNELSNKKEFLQIFSLVENKVKNITDYFYNNIFNKNSGEAIENLARTFKVALDNICKNNKIKDAKKVFGYEDLLDFGKSIVNCSFREIIESKIYEEIEIKIFEKFADEFKNHLLEYFNEVVIKTKNISKIFNKQGKDNIKQFFNKIKKSIQIKFEKDNLEDIFRNNQINSQNINHNNQQNNNQNNNSKDENPKYIIPLNYEDSDDNNNDNNDSD